MLRKRKLRIRAGVRRLSLADADSRRLVLDVRDDQIDMLKAWSDDFISVQAGNIPDDRVVVAARHTIEFEEFILAKLEERLFEKRDDLFDLDRSIVGHVGLFIRNAQWDRVTSRSAA